MRGFFPQIQEVNSSSVSLLRMVVSISSTVLGSLKFEGRFVEVETSSSLCNDSQETVFELHV